MLALAVSSARHLGIGIIVVFAVLAVVSATVIKNVTTKIISMLLMVAFALGAWTQRTNVMECSDQARAKASVGDTSATTCTFFGIEVDIPGIPDVDLPGTDTTSPP